MVDQLKRHTFAAQSMHREVDRLQVEIDLPEIHKILNPEQTRRLETPFESMVLYGSTNSAVTELKVDHEDGANPHCPCAPCYHSVR